VSTASHTSAPPPGPFDQKMRKGGGDKASQVPNLHTILHRVHQNTENASQLLPFNSPAPFTEPFSCN